MKTPYPHQQELIDLLPKYLVHAKGNPVFVAPTGAGKSLIQADWVKQICTKTKAKRVACLTHVQELIKQNVDELLEYYPQADAGVFCAGLGKKEMDRRVTFGTIQSVYKDPWKMGYLDYIFIDECHLLPPKGEGMYQQFIKAHRKRNPNLRIIGLSATPYRIGQGYLIDGGKERIFTDIIQTPGMEIGELIKNGFLANLVTPRITKEADFSMLKTANGDFTVESIERAFQNMNQAIVDEAVELGSGRKKWLAFCAGIDHAETVARCLRAHMSAETLTSAMPADQRRLVIDRFRRGKTKALVSVNMVTTGFNVRDVDLLLCMRPTQSPGLYVQMIGRGARTADGKADCMVLDYARLIGTHGPIDDVKPPRPAPGVVRELTDKEREEVLLGQKECRVCGSVIPIDCVECPECGQIIIDIHRQIKLSNQAETASIISNGTGKKAPIFEGVIKEVYFGDHQKVGSEKPVMMVEWWGFDSEKPSSIDFLLAREVVCWEHKGYARDKAVHWVLSSFGHIPPVDGVTDLVKFCRANRDKMKKPIGLIVSTAGRYPEIKRKIYEKVVC